MNHSSQFLMDQYCCHDSVGASHVMLEALPLDELRRACDARGLATHGTRQKLVGRLAALLVPFRHPGAAGGYWFKLETYGLWLMLVIMDASYGWFMVLVDDFING